MSQPSERYKTKKKVKNYYNRVGKIVSVDFNRNPVNNKSLEYMKSHKPYQEGERHE